MSEQGWHATADEAIAAASSTVVSIDGWRVDSEHIDDRADLSTFLLARLNEDEQAARDRCGGWHNLSCDLLTDSWPVSCDCGYPARVLAEVEAKRTIVELHHGMHHCPNAHVANYVVGTIACPTLRLLALPYADHPECHPSWLPPT